MDKLAKRKKPLTDKKWSEIFEKRFGMDYPYSWDPVNQEFRAFYGHDIGLSENAIVLFFSQKRIALLLGAAEFTGEDPLFPSILLKNAIQIKYRCTLTGEIRFGSKLIVTELPINSFMVPKDGEYFGLLDFLSA
jgi:hypothetical protein